MLLASLYSILFYIPSGWIIIERILTRFFRSSDSTRTELYSLGLSWIIALESYFLIMETGVENWWKLFENNCRESFIRIFIIRTILEIGNRNRAGIREGRFYFLLRLNSLKIIFSRIYSHSYFARFVQRSPIRGEKWRNERKEERKERFDRS